MNQNPNSSYYQDEEEIDLRILIYKALRKWRKALIVGLALAIVFAVFSAVKIKASQPKVVPVEPKAIGGVTFYISVEDKTLKEDQLNAKKNEITSLYASYVNNGGIYADISKKLTGYDVTGLKETVKFAVNQSGRTIDVTVTAKDTEACEAILKAVTASMSTKSKELQTTVYKHDLMVMNQSVYLETVEEAAKPAILGPALKKAIIGFVVGVFVICCYYAVEYVLSRKFAVEKISSYGYYILGEVYLDKEEKLNCFDIWLKKVCGIDQNKTDFATGCKLVQANVKGMLPGAKTAIAAVGAVDQSIAKAILDEKSSKIHYCGDILTDKDAIDALGKYDNVCVIAQENVNTVDDITRQVENLDAWGKKIVGIVVVK